MEKRATGRDEHSRRKEVGVATVLGFRPNFIFGIEDRIARIERVSIRIVTAALLILALTAVLLYGGFELAKFARRLWTSV